MTSISQTPIDHSLRMDLIVAACTAIALTVAVTMVYRGVDPRPAEQARDLPPIATIANIVSAAKYRPAASLVWDRTHVGSSLWRGDGLYVPEGGAAEVAFEDGTRLQLSENSLVIVDLPPQRNVAPKVALRRGTITGRAGTAGIRLTLRDGSAELPAGGEATVGEGSDGRTKVTVHIGEVTVHDSKGRSVKARAAERVVLDSKHEPTKEKLETYLLRPARGERIYFGGKSTSLSFKWRGSTTASTVEIADDRSFARILASPTVSGDTVTVDGLGAGAYIWRVRSAVGRATSEERALLLIRDVPPTLVRPASGQVLYLPGRKSSTFTWSAVPGVSAYRLQISSDRSFSKLASETDIRSPEYRVGGSLPEGIYHWRVRTLSAERGESPYSDTHTFRLLLAPLPRAPRLFDPTIEFIDRQESGESKPTHNDRTTEEPEDQAKGSWLWLPHLLSRTAFAQSATPAAPPASLILRWEAIPGIERYVVQISKDEAFSEILLEQQATETYLRWKGVSAEKHWWRVQSVDSNGRKGEFSKPRAVQLPAERSGPVETVEKAELVLSVSTETAAPPKPRSPQDDAHFILTESGPTVELTAHAVEAAKAYEFQVTTEETFAQPPRAGGGDRPVFAFRPTAPGAHRWRVRLFTRDGRVSAWSRPQKLMVYLAAPVIESPIDGAKIEVGERGAETVLRWRPVFGAGQYEVLASHAGQEVTRIRTDKTQTALGDLPEGINELRVRSLAGQSGSSKEATTIRIEIATPAVASGGKTFSALPFSPGAAIGVITNFGGVLSPTATAEASFRSPHMGGRLIGSARVGYHFAKVTINGPPRISATQHVVPVALGARFELQPIGVVPYISAHILFGILRVKMRSKVMPDNSITLFGVGAEASVGAGLALGPGNIFAELRYGWMRRRKLGVETDGGGLLPVIGYRMNR